MKQNNHSLDEFLRSQVEEADLSYKEAYWEKMSTLLDGEEKKKRFPFFWRGLSVFIVLLAIGIGAYLSPLFKSKSDKKNSNEIQTEQKILASVTQDMPVEKNENTNNEYKIESVPNKELNENKDKPQSENQKSIEDLNNQNDEIKLNQITTKRAESNQSNANQAIPKSQQSTSNSNEAIKNEEKVKETALAVNQITKVNQDDETVLPQTQSKRTKAKLAAKSQKLNQQSETIKTKKGAESETVKQNKQGVSKPKKNDESVNMAKVTTSNENIEISTNDQNQINSQNVSIQGRVMKPKDTVKYTKSTPIDPSQNNPRYIASLSNYIPERHDSITVISYLPTEIKDVPKEVSPEVGLPRNSEKRPFQFNMLAGVYANKAFAGNVSNSIKWGVSPYLGIGVDKPLTNQLTLSTHVGFTYFNGLNSEMSIDSKQYSFGLDSSRFSVAHKKLLQLYLPVSVYYKVLKNHYLMFALGASYNLDVSSQVTESKIASSASNLGNNNKSASVSSSIKSGYSNGFNQFDLFAQVGYSYQLFNKLMVQFTYQQGFLDMTKNTYFKNSLTNTQSRISIGLKYNFKRN